ncbi:probable endochitinase [Chironomus tepperi]|uniref:probable endochitinase n=1 Tax=Chironomus tepperi TaxID=113505 RepID=UPI00391F34DF
MSRYFESKCKVLIDKVPCQLEPIELILRATEIFQSFSLNLVVELRSFKAQNMKLIIGIILLQSVVLIYGQGLDGFCTGRPTGVYPHPDPVRCDLFVLCAVGVPILQECPANQIFLPWLGSDPPYGECLPGYPETCQLATAPTTTRTTTTSTTVIDTTTDSDDSTQTDDMDTTYFEITTDITTATEHDTTTTEYKSKTTSRLATTTSPIPVHRCPPSGFGYIPHHTNCNRYFECIAGIRHLRFCHDYWLFDSVTLRCTYPEYAVCAGGQ